MSERMNLPSGAIWEEQVGYSRAVRIGSHVWVSGTTGSGATAAEQARTAFERIAGALDDAGAKLSDVVRTRIFVTDIAVWSEIGAEHARVFGSIRPAATMVQVAALIAPDLFVEIEVDAFIA